MKEKSKTILLAEELLYTAFQILKENNNEMPINSLMKEIEKRAKLDDWAKEVYEKSGYTRWDTMLHMFSIDCVKAGFLIKQKGIWYLTKDGEEALKLGKEKLRETATLKYREWEKNNIKNDKSDNSDFINNNTIEEINKKNEKIVFEDAETKSRESISNFINSLNPYEFQDLCSALLRGMGYYTPFVAPRGKDGGIDK